MLSYHLFLAWKGIRRTPVNSLIVVLGIALGVAVATLFSLIHHTYARDPLPGKSSSIHYVRMDSWDPAKAYPGPGDIPLQITYADMIGIMKSDIPIRRTGILKASQTTAPLTNGGKPRRELTVFCHSDFFAMFGAPLRYGSGWDRSADERAEPVLVLGAELNDRWFGGANSVGQMVDIAGRAFRVVGVLSRWRPAIKVYDLAAHSMFVPEQLFIPMSHFRGSLTLPVGLLQGWGSTASGEDAWLTGERNIVQMWVELSGPTEVAGYRTFLDAYATEQKRRGRFQRLLDNRVTPLLDYMRERKCTPPEVTVMMIAADLFLAVCALGMTALLLSRFLSRASEVGARRALGARRWDIFMQHVVECKVVGLVGGFLGLVVTSACLWLVNAWFQTMTWASRDDMFEMDWTMAAFALAAALAAALLAGIYPAYRVCQIPPASHLKLQ